MVSGYHVLVGRRLGGEHGSAGIALVLRLVVICGIHVLLTGTVCLESPSACLAFESRGPVAIVIHVVVAIILIGEIIVTGIAFINSE